MNSKNLQCYKALFFALKFKLSIFGQKVDFCSSVRIFCKTVFYLIHFVVCVENCSVKNWCLLTHFWRLIYSPVLRHPLLEMAQHSRSWGCTTRTNGMMQKRKLTSLETLNWSKFMGHPQKVAWGDENRFLNYKGGNNCPRIHVHPLITVQHLFNLPNEKLAKKDNLMLLT